MQFIFYPSDILFSLLFFPSLPVSPLFLSQIDSYTLIPLLQTEKFLR
jgi:hypothetical protein